MNNGLNPLYEPDMDDDAPKTVSSSQQTVKFAGGFEISDEGSFAPLNDANTILQDSLGRASAATQDME